MLVKFKMEKVTKNTIRFIEILENELDVPKIGTIYIPKATLNVMKWKENMNIGVDIELEEDM